jgi:hypothetical protein
VLLGCSWDLYIKPSSLENAKNPRELLMIRKNFNLSISIILITIAVGASLYIHRQSIPVNAAGQLLAPTSSHTWPIARHDSGHTGYNSAETVLGPKLKLYDRLVVNDPDGGSFNNILVGSNRLYVQNLIAIWVYDRNDLSFQWRYGDCLSSTDPCVITGLAGLSEGRIVFVKQKFLPTPQAELVVLDGQTGNELWSYPVPNDIFPVFALEGSIIHLMWQYSGYHLISLSVFSGNEIGNGGGSFDGAFASGGPVVAGGRIFFTHGDQIIAHSTSSRDELWRYTDPLGDKFASYDLVALDDVLLVTQAERVFALSTVDKTVLWEKPAESCSPGYQKTLNVIATDGTYVSVAGICNADLVTYNIADGEEEWRATIGMFPAPSALAIANGILYVASLPSNYQIGAYDIASGAVLEQLPVDVEDITSVMAISDGFLYTVSSASYTGVQIFERTPADLRAGITEENLPFCGATVGGTLNYEFTVVNDGPGQADNVEATLTLPTGNKTIDTTTGACTDGISPVCSIGTLMKDEAVTITVQVTPNITGTHTAKLSLTGNPRDPLEDNNSISKKVKVVAASGADLIATDMEVTQGIQTVLNTVPMVTGKPTAVRAYIQTDGPEVANVTAILHGTETLSGDLLPGSPLSPLDGFDCVTVDGNFPDRTQLSETVLFNLPDDWLTGNIDLQVEINPTGAISDTIPINNTFSVPVAYEDAAPVCIRTYRVRTAGPQYSGGLTFNLSLPTSYLVADPDGIISRTLSMLPTAEIIVIPESQLLEEWEPSLFTDDDYGPYEFSENDKDDNKVMTTLWWHNVMSDPPNECVAAGARTHYMGMIHENTSGSDGVFNGKGNYDGDQFIARLRTSNNNEAIDDPPGGTTVAHELGHNYDRRHVPNAASCGSEPSDPWYSPWLVAETDVNYPYNTCTLDDAPLDALDTHFGFDLLTKKVVNPAQTGDLMSYASSRWTSDYTWKAFLGRFQAGLASADAILSQDTLAASSTVPDVLLVNGEVLSTTVRLDGLLRVPQTFVPANNLGDLLDVGVPSSYSLELLDEANTLLISKTLTLQVSTGLNTSELSFNTGIPFITDTVKIQVTLDGTPVVTQTVSPNAPVVNIQSPIVGETFTDTMTISWEASDPDLDSELIYMVQYSNDQGDTWRVLAPNVLTDTLKVDSSLLPGSLDESLVRVIASDGVNTGSDQSAFFTVTPRDPLVFIQHPAEGAIFYFGQPVSLRGIGYDPEDGTIPAGDLNWTVSGIGVVGSGKKLILTDLAVGSYTVTLSAMDSDGQVGSQTVNIEVTNSQSIYLPLVIR